MKKYSPDKLGPADISIAGLRVWVFGRESENEQDYWDGNWLRVEVLCRSEAAESHVSGSILHLSEVREWLDELNKLSAEPNGEARLSCMEPYLSARLELTSGRGALAVSITPDVLTEKREFAFAIDQSYLPELTSQLARVLRRFPIRGTP